MVEAAETSQAGDVRTPCVPRTRMRRPMTAASWPQIPDDGQRYESIPRSRTWFSRHRLVSAFLVWILTSEGTLEGGDVLPGFSCPVSEVFN